MRTALIALMLVTLAISASWGQTAPALLSYQGQLLSSAGSPITVPSTVRFTLLWGGSATENPSTGKPVYQEDVSLTPDGSGVFHCLIGAGSPTNGCDENRDGTAAEPCVLAPNDFPGAGTVVYLEMRIDPAGVNNLLLPRQPVASVPYALNAGTLSGLTATDFITAVSPGSGMTGGGTSGDVTISIAAGGVASVHLAASSVTGVKIAAGTITASNLAADSVGATQIQTGAVGTAEIADLSVANADIAGGAVTNAKLSLTSTFSTDLINLSMTESTLALGTFRFCALSKFQLQQILTSGDPAGCRVFLSGSTWMLGARGTGSTAVDCQAVCF